MEDSGFSLFEVSFLSLSSLQIDTLHGYHSCAVVTRRAACSASVSEIISTFLHDSDYLWLPQRLLFFSASCFLPPQPCSSPPPGPRIPTTLQHQQPPSLTTCYPPAWTQGPIAQGPLHARNSHARKWYSDSKVWTLALSLLRGSPCFLGFKYDLRATASQIFSYSLSYAVNTLGSMFCYKSAPQCSVT